MNSTSVARNASNSSVFPMHVWLGSWELICGLAGAFGNGFVMHSSSILVRESNQDPQHHIYIFSLTLANLIFCTVHCPLMFAHYLLGVSMNISYCNILYFFTHLSTVAASLSLLWINLNKFLLWKQVDTMGLTDPSYLSTNRLSTFIVTAWFVAIGWAFFVIFGPMTRMESNGTCQVHVSDPMLYINFFLVFFLIPISSSLFISIYVCYAAKSEAKRIALMWALRLHELDYSESESTSVSISINEEPTIEEYLEHQIMTQSPSGVWFVVVITVWSVITCLPYRISYIAFMIRPQFWLARLTLGLFSFMIANPAGVPFITILFLKEYRKKARQLFKTQSAFGF